MLALQWAQASGFPAGAAEVAVPYFRCRLDVAAYRPARASAVQPQSGSGKQRRVTTAAVGLTAIFECKVSRPDYLRDSRSLRTTAERLAILGERRMAHEETLKIHYPSIRNGDSLFPEYETFNFERPGYEPYQRVLADMRRLSRRLHANTKFEKLVKWRAANLSYVVSEQDLFATHELPADWGLLVREGDGLKLVQRPVFHEIEETQRLALLHRIAIAATRAAFKTTLSAGDDQSSRSWSNIGGPSCGCG